MTDASPTGPLAGLTVLDLSRVLAGPWSAQILGDLGADVIKVEQPGQGDDTRRWGPPFLDDGSGDLPIVQVPGGSFGDHVPDTAAQRFRQCA